jgi:hypothetical protein
MNFSTTSQNNNEQVFRIIDANSWSNCIAYLEGTGETVNQINIISNATTIVLNNPSSTVCYYVLLKDTVSKTAYNYIVFDESYLNLQNWISQQTGKKVISIQESEKNYVTV